MNIVNGAGGTPTICITAANIELHPKIVRDLDGMDLLVHGYQHVSYRALSPEQQASDLSRACSVFAAVGLHANGFRAPYLHLTTSTLPLLKERGFTHDSSRSYFALPRTNPLYAALLKQAELRYGDVETTSPGPYVDSGLVELPVCLPDDELMVDALNVRSRDQQLQVYRAMLDETAGRESLLVLQVHPERVSLCADALESTLRRATDMGGWLANLREVTCWVRQHSESPTRWPKGSSFAVAVTGDLDAVCIPDFWGRIWPGVGLPA